MSKIAVIGLAGESVFLTVRKFHEGGETIEADSLDTQPGGKGFNQAVAARRAGADVAFLAAVGNDPYAGYLREFLASENIRFRLCKKEDRTAYAAIIIDGQGRNRVTEYTGARLDVQDVEDFKEEIAKADILLLSNEVPAEVNEKAALLAQKYSTKVIVNPAPYRPLSAEFRNTAYLFTPNEYETCGLEDQKNVVVTMGEKGCCLRSTGKIIPARQVHAVDTTGAGDVFNGYLAAALAQGRELSEAAEFANVASGIAVTRKGAVTSIPHLEEVKREYGSLSERA